MFSRTPGWRPLFWRPRTSANLTAVHRGFTLSLWANVRTVSCNSILPLPAIRRPKPAPLTTLFRKPQTWCCGVIMQVTREGDKQSASFSNVPDWGGNCVIICINKVMQNPAVSFCYYDSEPRIFLTHCPYFDKSKRRLMRLPRCLYIPLIFHKGFMSYLTVYM